MPNRSQYKGYAFWHPKKLVRLQGGKGYHLTFSFTEDFEFRVILYGQGRFNGNTIIRQEYLTPNEMREAFGVVDKEINRAVEQETLKIIEKETVEVEITHHEPEKIEPVNNNIIKDLKKMTKFSIKKYIQEKGEAIDWRIAEIKGKQAKFIDDSVNKIISGYTDRGCKVNDIYVKEYSQYSDMIIKVNYINNKGGNYSKREVIVIAPPPKEYMYIVFPVPFWSVKSEIDDNINIIYADTCLMRVLPENHHVVYYNTEHYDSDDIECIKKELVQYGAEFITEEELEEYI
ncbi:hypothetical protein [Bergeyella zoohelcum]|uniref:hypothetical protein n=1 Tax=Bergeyella zoohelcum TaxID=1015 RepID=UPI003734C53E